MAAYKRTGMTSGTSTEKRKYHGAYKTWQNMMSRCTNSNTPAFKNYGGRGITVCERWRASENFLDDMLPTWFVGATLDRINNNGNYEKENCVWITLAENVRKTRRVYLVNYEGEVLTILQLSKRAPNISYQTILNRFHKGFPVDQLLNPITYSRG